MSILSQLVRSRRVAAVSLALLGVVLLVAIAQACNVPVFRFALERWRADAYRVTIFHEGPLTAADKEVLTKLEEQQEKSRANVLVRALDITELEEADQELLKALPAAKYPLLAVQYPAPLQLEMPVWSQPLSAKATTTLLDSPLRKELLNRLVDGESSVWLLLECGDAAKDNAAAELLAGQLAKLAKELQLPELTDLPDDNLVAKTPLKLSFSMLRVPRSEAEAPLVQMLVNCEPDLPGREDPMVFPVFGRGRALLPLIGAGITADNIKNSAAFLVGACSCEVKELNPGFDLLLTADWDELLSADGQPLPIVKTRNLPPGKAELVAIPPGNKSSASKTQPTSLTTSSPRAAARPHSNAGVYSILAIAGAAVAWIVLANMNKGKSGA
jgi:hypothetical protein